MKPGDFRDDETAEDATAAVEALGALLVPLLPEPHQREAMRLLTALQWRLEEMQTRLAAIEDSLRELKPAAARADS